MDHSSRQQLQAGGAAVHTWLGKCLMALGLSSRGCAAWIFSPIWANYVECTSLIHLQGIEGCRYTWDHLHTSVACMLEGCEGWWKHCFLLLLGIWAQHNNVKVVTCPATKTSRRDPGKVQKILFFKSCYTGFTSVNYLNASTTGPKIWPLANSLLNATPVKAPSSPDWTQICAAFGFSSQVCGVGQWEPLVSGGLITFLPSQELAWIHLLLIQAKLGAHHIPPASVSGFLQSLRTRTYVDNALVIVPCWVQQEPYVVTWPIFSI